MITLIAAGRLGANGELRKTQTGDSVLSFSVAVDNGKDKNGEKRPATWLRCAIWGKRGESLEQFMHKGRSVTVTGRPRASAYENQGRIELMVNEIVFQSPGTATDSTPQTPVENEINNEETEQGTQDFDDEIPF